MAKKPVKILQRSGGEQLTNEMVENLIGGCDLLAGLNSPFRDEADRRRTFLRHEKELIGKWILKHPGTRPPVWWDYCAKEPRRVVGQASRPLAFPMIGKYRRYDIVESDFQYLKRLNLFVEGEDLAVLASDFIC